jgi:hypothetical protein
MTPCDVLLLDLRMDEWVGDLIETLARFGSAAAFELYCPR